MQIELNERMCMKYETRIKSRQKPNNYHIFKNLIMNENIQQREGH